MCGSKRKCLDVTAKQNEADLNLLLSVLMLFSSLLCCCAERGKTFTVLQRPEVSVSQLLIRTVVWRHQSETENLILTHQPSSCHARFWYLESRRDILFIWSPFSCLPGSRSRDLSSVMTLFVLGCVQSADQGWMGMRWMLGWNEFLKAMVLHHGPSTAHPTLGWTTPELSLMGRREKDGYLRLLHPGDSGYPQLLPVFLFYTYTWMYSTLKQVETGSVCVHVCLGALMACSINHEMMKGISFI